MIKINGETREDKCDQCGDPQPAMYILKNDLWLAHAQKHEYICLDCFENRLGRCITIHDLKSCGITNSMLLGIRIWRLS
jgi:hypothetical protein